MFPEFEKYSCGTVLTALHCSSETWEKKKEKKSCLKSCDVIIFFNVKCSYDKIIELDLCTVPFCKSTVYLISLPPFLHFPLCH